MRQFIDNDVHLADHNLQLLPANLRNDVFWSNIPIGISSLGKRDISTTIRRSYLWNIRRPYFSIRVILHYSHRSLGNDFVRTIAPGHINILICGPFHEVWYFLCVQYRVCMSPSKLPIALSNRLTRILYLRCPPFHFVFTSSCNHEPENFYDFHCCNELYWHDYSIWIKVDQQLVGLLALIWKFREEKWLKSVWKQTSNII